jgi:DNA-binding LacI/PurR family transcriptional regulator
LSTIDDVAKLAGVSKSTVSSVFSKKRPISAEVTQRVLAVSNELGFRPSFLARSLANRRTQIIGLKMMGEKIKFSQFHLSLLNGVLEECYKHGYRLLVNTLSEQFSTQVENLSWDPVDGDILLDPAVKDERIEERIARKLPFVVIGRPSEEYESAASYVDNDNIGMGRRVTDYLLKLGHQRILFLNSQQQRTVSVDREAGYKQALGQAGHIIDPDLIKFISLGQSSIEYGYKTFKQAIANGTGITAVIADTDKVALGVYQAAAELQLKVPEDISVVAFSDNSVFAPEFNPPLTGVRQNGEMLGREAARLLIEHCLNNQSIQRKVLISTQLIERDSCAQVKKSNQNLTSTL